MRHPEPNCKWPRLLAAVAMAVLGAAWSGAAPAQRTIVFFGDSLTAGYGLEDPDTESFPARIEAKVTAAGLPWKVVNAGLSGETTAGGLRRIDWVLRQDADVVVLELGGNDGLRGTAPEVTRANLQAIIDRVRALRPHAAVILAGMVMPTSMGQDYASAFRGIYPDLASTDHLILIPFLLEGVAGNPRLNQADGIHPTAAGDEIVANTVWKSLLPVLRKNQ